MAQEMLNLQFYFLSAEIFDFTAIMLLLFVLLYYFIIITLLHYLSTCFQTQYHTLFTSTRELSDPSS